MTAKIKTHHHSSGYRHKPRGVSNRAFEKVYWPYIPMLLVAGALLALTARAGVLTSMIDHPTKRVLAYATSMSSNELLSDTNQDRQTNNVAGLKLNSELAKAAQAKANDMAARDYWSHNTPDGNPPWVFVSAQNYQYQKIGENLATGFSNSLATINGWMASPEHRENMLDPAYSEVGFGYANIPNYAAIGGGPMTIVVAFYGEPEALATAITTSPASPLSSNSSSLSAQTKQTSRAQLAFAGSPIGSFATLAAFGAMVLVLGIWIGRHALAFRRALAGGEKYILTHPLFDVGLLLIGLALFALTKTAGLIQ
ncbi:MAG TPA: CAP domain-containing protein [Candidatus Binatia bacterium]|nr:CAP domain-containing protein [Candidatus Binatia bacterium]